MNVRLLNGLVLAALLMGASSAWSHASMHSSTPKDGETVAQGLSQIELMFSEPLRVTMVTVAKPGDGAPIALKDKLPSSFVSNAKLGVDPLAAGSYEVNWRGVSDDGHVMNGHFKFSVSDKKPSP